MNVPTASGVWTHEQGAEAMLDMAVKAAPRWAEQFWLLVTTVRDAAPPDEREAWMQTTADRFTRDYAAPCDRIVAEVGASPDQVERFAYEVADTIQKRVSELIAASPNRGGSA